MPERSQDSRSRSSLARPRDLTREKVIEAGLDLLDREGWEAVTMRSLAVSLSVTPMALYNHVSSKNDLLRAIAAYVLDNANFDGGASDWRTQLSYCSRELRAICLRHPGLARLLEVADMAPTTVFAPMEVVIKALTQVGMSEIDAFRSYFTLVSFILVQASYQSLGPYSDLEPKRIAGRGYDALEQVDLPREWDFDSAFEFGLGLILDGVEAAVLRANGEN